MFSPLFMEVQNLAITTEKRAEALSITSVINDIAGAFLSLSIGIASDINLSLAMLIGALFCAIGLVFYIIDLI